MDEEGVLSLPLALTSKQSEVRRGGQNVNEIVVDLYVKLRPSLFGYIYSVVDSTTDSEDLVQVAFMKLFDELNRGSEIRNARGWLYGVAHNLAINHLRVRRTRENLGLDALVELEATQTSAEEEVIRRQAIEQALGKLNERERHSLMLRAEGLSYQEIGEVLEISAKSVSVYLARGLKKFGVEHEDM